MDKKLRYTGTILILLIIALSSICPNSIAQHTNDLKQAAALFHAREYHKAIPLLESIIKTDPTNDQAVFGLGVALIMIAQQTQNATERESIIVRAEAALKMASELDIEDYLLASYLKELQSTDETTKIKAADSLASLWSLHPPLVFDNVPPKGIHLPAGYRHKSSSDFEGMVGGIMWKPGGLKIEYEFAGLYQSDAVERMKKEGKKPVWYEEKQVGEHKFKCFLTQKNLLVIAVLISGDKEDSLANFFAQVRNQTEIEEILSIVTNLKVKSRREL